MTLRWRLTLAYAAASAVLFAVAAGGFSLAHRRGTMASADRALMAALDEAEEDLDVPGPADPARARARLTALSDSRGGLFVCLLDARGTVLYRSDPVLPAEAAPASPGRTALATVPVPGGGELRVAARDLPEAAGGLRLQLALRLPPSASALGETEGAAFLAVLLALVCALGATGWVIAGQALAPIARIAGVAEAARRGDLRRRIPPSSRGDELGRLIAVLNDMLDRVESSTTRLDRFAAEVSHQLRTPLTVMRGEIEVALRGGPAPGEAVRVLESALAEAEKMSLLVEDLLAYARSSGGSAPAAEDLDRLVAVVARKAAVLASAKGVRVETKTAPVRALVQAVRLEQALLDVVDNAVKHTPAGGTITLSVRRADGRAEIAVADTGPGIPAEERGRLFERGGAGIGLGLARALVESFGGRLDLDPPGAGLTVRFTLPPADDA